MKKKNIKIKVTRAKRLFINFIKTLPNSQEVLNSFNIWWKEQMFTDTESDNR